MTDEIEMILEQFRTYSSPFWTRKAMDIIDIMNGRVEKSANEIRAFKERYLEMERQRGVFQVQLREKQKELLELQKLKQEESEKAKKELELIKGKLKNLSN